METNIQLFDIVTQSLQVQAHIAKLRRQLSMIEGMPQHSKALPGM